MKKFLALLLALVMTLSLAACNSTSAVNTSSPSEEPSQAVEPSEEPSQAVEPSEEPSQVPEASVEPAEPPAPDPSEEPESSAVPAPGEPTLTLSSNDFTLFYEGAYHRLRYTCEPDYDAIPEFSSSDETVATVAEDGTVTAVAPGRALITVTYGDLTATCVVRCRWEEAAEPSEEPSEEPSDPVPPIIVGPDLGGPTDPSPEPSQDTAAPTEPTGPSASDVDLSAFFQTVMDSYQFPSMDVVPTDFLANLYPDLAEIPVVQRIVSVPMMTGVAAELTLIQVANSADVQAARDVLQARVDAQVGGGAFYPATIEQWQNNARIVVSGNYLMLVVNAQSDLIADDFNALF